MSQCVVFWLISRILDAVVVHAVPLSAEGILTVNAFHIFAIRYQMNQATATTSS